MFIGYSLSQKGYKVYDLKTNVVIISKDVILYEHFFPFQYTDKKESSHFKTNFIVYFPLNSKRL